MQDRFKFRVWHKKRKRMYEVLHLHTETWANGGEWVTAKGFNIVTQQDIHIQIEPKDSVIMQCTGLKDKNSNLIYEGDIIVNEKFVKYIIKWNDNIGQFYISKINPSKYDNWKDWHLARHDLDYEVIGNIYENKELLESKEE